MCLPTSMQCAAASCVTDYRDAVATSMHLVLLCIYVFYIAKLHLRWLITHISHLGSWCSGNTINSVVNLCSIILLQCLPLQGVHQEGIGMIVLRSVSVQMEESVNWTELAYALKDLVDPTAQNQVFETLVCKM